jgi:hypothetical protein
MNYTPMVAPGFTLFATTAIANGLRRSPWVNSRQKDPFPALAVQDQHVVVTRSPCTVTRKHAGLHGADALPFAPTG